MKVTFCLEMVMFLLKNEKFLISSSHSSGPIVQWTNGPMHYGEVEKKCQKWSTLEYDFSTDFHPKWVKYWLKLSELFKNGKKEKIEKGKRKMERKNANNLLLVFVKVKLGVKKSVLVRKTIFVKQTFLTNTSNSGNPMERKTHWNIVDIQLASISTN